jgi:hypothetical protein
MAKAGKFLGLISPVLAIGVAALMLFGSTYSYESADCRSGHAHQPSYSECKYRSGTISAFRATLEEGDSTLFICSGFVVIVSLVAAAGALTGRVAPIWACAAALWFLVGLGMLTIGLFISPLAFVLVASAALLTVARYESGTHESTNY